MSDKEFPSVSGGLHDWPPPGLTEDQQRQLLAEIIGGVVMPPEERAKEQAIRARREKGK